MGGNHVYRCSNGCYYGDSDIWERFESNAWTPVCWDQESGTEWVETRTNDLLVLEPVSSADLPDYVEIRRVDAGVSVSSPPPLAACR